MGGERPTSYAVGWCLSSILPQPVGFPGSAGHNICRWGPNADLSPRALDRRLRPTSNCASRGPSRCSLLRRLLGDLSPVRALPAAAAWARGPRAGRRHPTYMGAAFALPMGARLLRRPSRPSTCLEAWAGVTVEMATRLNRHEAMAADGAPRDTLAAGCLPGGRRQRAYRRPYSAHHGLTQLHTQSHSIGRTQSDVIGRTGCVRHPLFGETTDGQLGWPGQRADRATHSGADDQQRFRERLLSLRLPTDRPHRPNRTCAAAAVPE